MAVETNLPATGAIAAPPEGAPLETALPVQADAGSIVVHDRTTGQPTGEVLTPAALALAHERTLAPLTYGKTDQSIPHQSVVSGKAINEVDPFYKAVAERKAAHEADAIANGAMPA